ncbi:MAG TPA: TolC family protein [Nitrospiria bacterium]|nr:TolC family protein [Nitrospiria bacterium]
MAYRRSRIPFRYALAVIPLLGGALWGCALNPPPSADEIRSQTLAHAELPPKWKAPGAAEGAVVDGWLATFNDASLRALVEEALVHNADLRVAATRVEQAGGYLKVAGASLYPAVTALGRAGGKLSGDNSGLTGILVSASWEIDLWGRVRYGRAAATQQYASALSDFEYGRQSLAAMVAKSWFLATEAKQQKETAAQIVTSAEQLLNIARQRLRVGAGNELDVAVAQANLDGYRDTLRQLELAYEQSLRALELLLGRYPAAAMEASGKLDLMPPPVPAGLPSELLERRPDVVAAERRVAAAFDRVGEAKAAMLPKISLTAGVSSVSSDLFVLKDHNNPVWSAGANLLAPIYQGGALRAQVEIRTSEQKQALAEYAQAGLRAFGEVENALATEFTLKDRQTILMNAVTDNERALELANVQYRVGSVDLRSVSQQQLALFAARSALIRVQSEARVQRVNLYLALGGSFKKSEEEKKTEDGTQSNLAPPSPTEETTGSGKTTN